MTPEPIESCTELLDRIEDCVAISKGIFEIGYIFKCLKVI